MTPQQQSHLRQHQPHPNDIEDQGKCKGNLSTVENSLQLTNTATTTVRS